ncbi:MAG: glycosyltransferase family 4 protein [candidate division KSB1 bacterium]|jgi:glycosyltransferase involved in cell wall biosynthesis|nr:glycosyltransferase family 4 protein [candidate division KSB1 bacterium]
MKIVYFNYMWDLWGASIGSTIKALELLKALSSCGHEVKDYWMRDDLARKNFESGPSNSSHRDVVKKYLGRYLHEPNQFLKNVKSIPREKEIIRSENPDMIIARLDVHVYSPVVLAKKFDIPFLIEIDSPRSYEKIKYQTHYKMSKSMLRWMELKFVRSGVAGFTVSNQIKQHFVDRGIEDSFIEVIPNGADPDRFSPEVPSTKIDEKYGLHDSTVVGFVGSFIFWHGIENLTSIIQSITGKYGHVKFLLVGQGGPLEGYLKKFIADNNLNDRVILTGHVPHDEVPAYISAMDIVLAPYPEMDFFYYSPVKIYEYMSCGKPVVSSRIGQIAEIIDDRVTGFLTTPNHIEKISEVICELVEDNQLREKVGVAARSEILKNHTWKKRGEQLSRMCEKFSK